MGCISSKEKLRAYEPGTQAKSRYQITEPDDETVLEKPTLRPNNAAGDGYTDLEMVIL